MVKRKKIKLTKTLCSVCYKESPQRAFGAKTDVVLTSMRRDYVASTSIRRHFGTKCPLGYGAKLTVNHLHKNYSWKQFSETYCK